VSQGRNKLPVERNQSDAEGGQREVKGHCCGDVRGDDIAEVEHFGGAFPFASGSHRRNSFYLQVGIYHQKSALFAQVTKELWGLFRFGNWSPNGHTNTLGRPQNPALAKIHAVL
jgi:hypothetical protein